jgi:hypothetical protein
MSTVKLYAPMILLLFWAVIFTLAGGLVLAVVAGASIGGAVKIQLDEEFRQHRKRRWK